MKARTVERGRSKMDKVKGEKMRRGNGTGGTKIILHLPQDNI